MLAAGDESKGLKPGRACCSDPGGGSRCHWWQNIWPALGALPFEPVHQPLLPPSLPVSVTLSRFPLGSSFSLTHSPGWSTWGVCFYIVTSASVFAFMCPLSRLLAKQTTVCLFQVWCGVRWHLCCLPPFPMVWATQQNLAHNCEGLKPTPCSWIYTFAPVACCVRAGGWLPSKVWDPRAHTTIWSTGKLRHTWPRRFPRVTLMPFPVVRWEEPALSGVACSLGKSARLASVSPTVHSSDSSFQGTFEVFTNTLICFTKEDLEKQLSNSSKE